MIALNPKAWLVMGLSTLTLALASCERSAETETPAPKVETPVVAPAAPAFSHEISSDLSGYYMPATEMKVGDLVLDHMFVGQAFEFASWEGGERSATFAPVMLQFDDTSSPVVANEMGGESHGVTVRVLPTTYAVDDESIRFAGTSEPLGTVSFEGRLDPGALATARRNLGGGEGVVLTGTLRIGDRTINDAAFRWYGGD